MTAARRLPPAARPPEYIEAAVRARAAARFTIERVHAHAAVGGGGRRARPGERRRLAPVKKSSERVGVGEISARGCV